MDYILYLFIFAIGITFGSFYTLAIYRIPKTQDILHTHSYCPKCEHKLGFFDLIPLFSYIFLGGKCRYCKDKIRPRYFVIELLSGLFFMLLAFLMNFTVSTLSLSKLVEFGLMVLYFSYIVIMAGIDKEYRQIQDSVIYYGIVIGILYMIYLYVIDPTSIYRYGIYVILYAVTLIASNITLKKYASNKYAFGIIFTLITMAIFTQKYVTILTIVAVLLAIFIYLLIKKIQNLKNPTKENYFPKMQIGYMLGITNISFLLYILAHNQFMV